MHCCFSVASLERVALGEETLGLPLLPPLPHRRHHLPCHVPVPRRQHQGRVPHVALALQPRRAAGTYQNSQRLKPAPPTDWEHGLKQQEQCVGPGNGVLDLPSIPSVLRAAASAFSE